MKENQSKYGRHSATPTKGYGVGGLLKDKKNMFSLT